MKLSRAHRQIPALVVAVVASIPVATAFEMMAHRAPTPTAAPPPVGPARSGSSQPQTSSTPSTPAGSPPKRRARRWSTVTPRSSPTSTPRHSIKSPIRLGKPGVNPGDQLRIVKPSNRTSRKHLKTAAASRRASRAGSAVAPSGTFTGPPVSDPFGVVQASVTVVQGRITDVGITAPKSNPVSANINSQAVVYLRTETLHAQSANISTISGATATSQAYLESLRAALDKIPKSTAPKSNRQSQRRTAKATSRRLTSAPSGSRPRLRIKDGSSSASLPAVKPAQLFSRNRRTASRGAAAAHTRSTPAIDGTFKGPSVSDPYGVVQTTLTVRAGRITNVAITAPMNNSVSSTINSQAIGYLRTETLTAQSANISGISGATATSRAYVQSLKAALALMPSTTGSSQTRLGSPGSKSSPATPATNTIPHFRIKGGANDESGSDEGASARVAKPGHRSSTTSGPASRRPSVPPTASRRSQSSRHFAIKKGSEGAGGPEGSRETQSSGKHTHTARKHSRASKDA